MLGLGAGKLVFWMIDCVFERVVGIGDGLGPCRPLLCVGGDGAKLEFCPFVIARIVGWDASDCGRSSQCHR